MPLCLDTEHISDYGFTVKINELCWGDTSWEAVVKMGFKEIWSSHWPPLTLSGDPLKSNSQPINYCGVAFLHLSFLTSNKLLDLTLSDITERHVDCKAMKTERWPKGSNFIICNSSVQISETHIATWTWEKLSMKGYYSYLPAYPPLFYLA